MNPDDSKKQKIYQRTLTAVIFAGVVLACILGHPLLMTFFIIGALSVALFELNNAFAISHFKIPVTPVFVGGVLILLAAYFGGPSSMVAAFVISCSGILVYTCFEENRQLANSRLMSGLFAITYLPFFASFLVMLVNTTNGPGKVILGILIVCMSDTGGYFVGSKFGKRPLAPNVSPKKSWEGFAGSIALATLSAAIYIGIFFPQVYYSGRYWFPIVLALTCVIVGTLGDLMESMLKRDVGIKDMGTFLAGHGGILDRIDSILISAPVFYYLISAFV